MTRNYSEENEIIAVNALNSAKLAITERNFWLAKSYLKTAISHANKAGRKAMACRAMAALQCVNAIANA